jgi:hypothetical protein
MPGPIRAELEHAKGEPGTGRRDPKAPPVSPLCAGNQVMQALLRGGWLRPKLEVGGVDDPEEREADAVADRIMRMPEGECCAACAEGGACEDETVRRKAEAASAPRPSLPRGLEHQVRRLTSGGEPLTPSLRAYFEPRLGRDLGAARIHHDSRARDAAAAIRAKAFTVGEHIAIGTGHWSPESATGRRLLGHELAHVARGHAAVRRQPAVPEPTPPFRPAPGQLGRETSRVTGRTRRIEVGIARTTSCGWTRHLSLVFDPDDECLIETGGTVEFRHPPVPARQLPSDQFEAMATRFLAAANDYLGGWYALKITGAEPGCTAPCRDIEMPIRVRLVRQAGGHPITISPGSGRETAGQLYGSTSTGTLRHEAGHVALGASDEYREPGVACREGEHVEERDFSLMASNIVYGRRSLLHPRHFSHIVHWFETEFPRCRIELVELKTPSPVDFDLQLGLGTFGMGGIRGFAFGVGLGVGLPLDRLRNWAFTIGPHANLLNAHTDGQSRDAYLFGLRFGLERRFTPSAGGPLLGGFAELGYGRFSLSDWGRGIDETAWGGYGAIGARAGWGFGVTGFPSLAIEAQVGAPIGAPGRIGEPGGGFPPTAREGWWQLGVTGAVRF